ncbi:hypothetical protein [Stenotrophomonas sp. MMGLT7]|uniref:hypothetical protein n=1 Tax=Stenotrophomonas sp. MMGLT7 TaxID=2901227 RepID=UPI001E446AAB|nr:hypothetical protein [Stenotrophomonas sp. MMGLT7]MCD7096922.1 hypothetical protein [Stenotrophomonas sp. MMGLT7]
MDATKSLLPLPIFPATALARVIRPALATLPARMTSAPAEVMILAIMLQESRLAHRWQVVDLKRPEVKGPARGLAQFELGTQVSRGGVWGIYQHAASRTYLQRACAARGVAFEPRAIWLALERDDILAAVCARLLLWTDPQALPALDDSGTAWALYIRTWRPGKPKPETWTGNYRTALQAVAP